MSGNLFLTTTVIRFRKAIIALIRKNNLHGKKYYAKIAFEQIKAA
jgi:hypothetical protein